MSEARRVVTLPPGLSVAGAQQFAARAHSARAHYLEVRSDLHPGSLDVAPLAGCLQLLLAERGSPLPEHWLPHAAIVDRPLPARPGSDATLWSFHAAAPMSPDEAEAHWRSAGVAFATGIKHVEPVGAPASAGRLFETQRRLAAWVGAQQVTVLATGAIALPFRCVLAERNALDYVALGPTWAPVEGQRLLADAVRAARARPGQPRLGAVGSGLLACDSPRMHAPPFDRIDLPADCELERLLDVLLDHYRGLEIHAPFERRAAAFVGGEHVDTVWRAAQGARGADTRAAGAAAVLDRLGGRECVVLGSGGAAGAFVAAAEKSGRALHVLDGPELGPRIRHPAIWNLDAQAAPDALSFERGVRVAVLARGPSGAAIASEVSRRGGTPVHLGATWQVARARLRRELWERA